MSTSYFTFVIHRLGINGNLTWTSADGNYSETIKGVFITTDPWDIVFNVPINVEDFTIKFCIESDCGDGLKEHCFEIPFVYKDECCTNTEIDIPNRSVLYSNEGYKLVATYKNGTNFWGYYHYGHLAFIRLSDGKKLKAKKLEISFDVTNRSSPSSLPACSPLSETDYDDCTNCKWISENVYSDDDAFKFHKRNDVIVSYKGSRGTTTGTIQIVPEYCY